eukprot:jgi/Sobl393_1/19206/SZX60145.1
MLVSSGRGLDACRTASAIAAVAVRVHSIHNIRSPSSSRSNRLDQRRCATHRLQLGHGNNLTLLRPAWCSARIAQPRAVAPAALLRYPSSSSGSALCCESSSSSRRLCRVQITACPALPLGSSLHPHPWRLVAVAKLTGTRTFSSSSSSGSSSSRSAGGSPSGSDSDSDTDPVARLGIDPAELGPNGELPWYYTDNNVKAAWQITDQQELQYWQEVMENVQKPKVQQSLAQLDLRQRLGLPFAVPKQLKQPSGWGWFRRAKSRNPMAVALVKVGAFYEAAGLDALLLVEHAGLNLMGSNLEVPRAGCPEANLLALLRVLVEERGLSVAVWEEMASGAEYGRRSKDQKQRFFSQLVTPENPAYLHGYADSASDRDVNVPTLCGVSGSISGLSVYRLNRAAAAVEVFKGLSEDGLWGLLAADSSAPGVVYLHRPYSQLQQASTAYASDADRTQAALAKRLKAAGMRVHTYAGADPLAAFKEQVATALAMPAAQLTTRQARDMGSWPGLLPLYLSTLLQLGLLRNRGIPGLVDYLVPDDAPRAVREALAALLSAPPPHEVAAATRQARRATAQEHCRGSCKCVSGSISGLSVYRLNRAAAAVEVFKGLSEDGLWGLLAADSSAPGVVYLHRPYSQLQQASTAYASDIDRTQATLAKRLKAAGMRVHTYAGADPLAAFKEQVATALAMPAAQLTTRQARDMGSWPGLLPLYLSTLLQLGLLRNRGIPGLVDYLVPDDAPRAVREALAALLSAPPPHEVAAATRQALRGMLCYEGALPGWQCGGVTPKKVAVVLQAGEAPEKFFQALAATLQPVVSSLDPATCPPALAAIVKDLWPLLLHTMPAEPQQLSHSAVLAACRDALAAISRVVAQPGSSS